MDIKIPDNYIDRLKHTGVQGYVFQHSGLDLTEAAGRIEGLLANGKPKTMSSKLQVSAFKNLCARPLDAPYTYCISSSGTDTRAKYVASYLLYRALKVFETQRTHTNRINPHWHVLTGSYQDELRDKAARVRFGKKPALLVLTNVVSNSSDVKVEKLRDILELHSDVPRVVVITGADPITFFSQRLQYPLNGALYLGKPVREYVPKVVREAQHRTVEPRSRTRPEHAVTSRTIEH